MIRDRHDLLLLEQCGLLRLRFAAFAGEVRAGAVDTRKKKELQRAIRENIEAGAAIFSDDLKSYDGLDAEYQHDLYCHRRRLDHRGGGSGRPYRRSPDPDYPSAADPDPDMVT